MIRTEAEYKRTLQQLQEAKAHHGAQQVYFQAQGVPEDAARIALDATYTFLAGLQEDVDAYERAKRGELSTLRSLSNIGRWLIHARIAQGITQKKLAEMLGVSEAQVSRDERNEYHGISVERAQSILDRMGVQFRIEEIQEGATPEARPYSLPLTPEPVYGFLRAKKNLSPEKAAEVARVLNAVYDTMTADVPTELTKE